jgi:cysteine desulfurase / selenocysteine lyase
MREQFPIFKKYPNLTYLDSAATTHKPQCVVDAVTRFYSEEYATVHRAVYRSALQATEKYNETRETAARFLNARSPSEIIFTRGTTDGINLVAASWGRKFLKKGDEVLISQMEHHSNIVPWQLLCQEKGAVLRWIPMNGQGVLEWEGKITPQTKIVAVGHISNVTGTVNPIEEIAKEAHRVGALVLIDGAQAAPHLSIDVQKLDCDFYALSGHKCYGPTGVGILYGKKEILDEMPPVQGGGDMIERVDLEKSTYQGTPLRFEAGTPLIGPVIALKTALDFVKTHPLDERLLPLATERLLKIPGLRILGTAPLKGPILTFDIEGVHPLDLATFLDLKEIAIRSGHLCAQPLLRSLGISQACRISFGVYNTPEEVEKFGHALEEALLVLRG